MKNQTQQDHSPAGLIIPIYSVPLHELVTRVQRALLPQAIEKWSFIVNDVDEKIRVLADEDILAFIVGGMISNAICSTTHACISIEAIQKDADVQVVVNNKGSITYPPNRCSLTTILTAARIVGGGISLKSEAGGGFSVALSIGAAA